MLLLLGAAACGNSQPSEEEAEGEATEEMAQEEGEAMEEEAESQPLSPPRTAEGTIGSTSVTINYSSPRVRDREIWGSLVPYGQVWRAGANEATTIEFSGDVVVEGQPLEAGSYSFWAIPNEDTWTIIFNGETGQWGTNYNESKDVLRVEVTPQPIDQHVEGMEFVVEDDGIVLRWEKLAVPVKITEAGES
jgi:hypothetical protein